MKKILLFFAAGAMSLGAAAAQIGQYFTSGNLRYMVESVNPPVAAIVAPEGASSYEGDITIPATVTYSATTYKVNVADSGNPFYKISSLTFDPDYSGALKFSIDYSEKFKKLTLPKKANSETSLISFKDSCPLYDITMDVEGDNIVLNPKTVEIYRWDGEKAKFGLYPARDKTAPVIYPDSRNRITVAVKDAEKYKLDKAKLGEYDPHFLFTTDPSNPDQAAKISFIIPEDYSGVTVADGLLDYSIVGGKAVVKGFSKDMYVENLIIPSTIKYDGKDVPVKKIGYKAFGSYGLKSMNLGNVEEISEAALGPVDMLFIPATLKKAGYRAFAYVNICVIDPAAKMESDISFGQAVVLSSLQIDGETAKARLTSNIYKNGKPVKLYLRTYQTKTEKIDIMPDADGLVTIEKSMLMKKIGNKYRYSGTLQVMADDPAIEGILDQEIIPESEWIYPEGFIYIIGDVTAWNKPNDPESGVNTDNSFRLPAVQNADFYKSYVLPIIEKSTKLYAGTFYLPANEVFHDRYRLENLSQFRFIKALSGWDTPDHIGASMDNFTVIPEELDIIGRIVYEGGLSNWGIECAETTPITVALQLEPDDQIPRVHIKRGEYTVIINNERGYVEPEFIPKNAGADEAVTDEADEADNADAPVEWYNLQGMRVAEPTHGMYIRRQGTRTSKILVK